MAQNKQLKTADKTLKKALEKQQKAQQKRDEIASQLQEKRESREVLIHQVANEEASEEALNQNRNEIAKLEDRLQVQEKALEHVNQEVEQAKREVFHAEVEAFNEVAASFRRRANELWPQLENLLAELKRCMGEGTGDGGLGFANRVYRRALAVEPAAKKEQSPKSQYLLGEERGRIRDKLTQEEYDANFEGHDPAPTNGSPVPSRLAGPPNQTTY